MLGMTHREFHKTSGTVEYLRCKLEAALVRGKVMVVSDQVDELLTENFIKVEKTSKDYRRLSLEVLKTWVKAPELIEKRQHGEVIDTPQSPAEAFQSNTGSLKLSELFEKWKAEKRSLSPKSVSDFAANIHGFIDLHGDLDVKEITRGHVRDFKDAMLRYPARMPPAIAQLPIRKILARTDKDETL